MFRIKKDIVRRDWTQEEIDTAIRMRAEGKTAREVGEVVGRSAGAVRDLWTRVRDGQVGPRRRQGLTEEEKDRANAMLRSGVAPREVAKAIKRSLYSLQRACWLARKAANGIATASTVFVKRIDIPTEVMEERDRRYAEPRTIGMEQFGDPPPSQSALGRFLP